MIQILVIDDEDPIRNLLARMIELEGYKVWKASDCQSALKLLKAQLVKPQHLKRTMQKKTLALIQAQAPLKPLHLKQLQC